MYKLSFFVPDEAVENVKQAVFSAGAGRIGTYDSCSWQVKGIGQFRPLSGSQPYLGKLDEVEQVEEWKVEMVCADEYIQAAVSALKSAHPYEEVAYDVYQLVDIS